MKFWRQLRGATRALFHLALVAGPIWGMARAQQASTRMLLAVLLLGGLVLLAWAAFVYWPGFDPLFRIPWRGPRRGRRMAITFDDGPNGDHTMSVLRLLDQHQAKATFFMIGQNIELQPELARQVAAAGHAVGSHTYSHRKLNQVSLAEAVEEIDRGHAALTAAGIPDVRLFRAPHGLKTFAVARHLARRGLRLIAWTAGVYDTDCPDASVIARRAERWVRPGTILLLHDGKLGHDRRPMTTALESVLQLAQRRRIRLVTVPQLLGWS
ncbi:MAG: polysaccharide deacetylase family protein [Polyangia bacterium]|jgi:peptidoglycan/xylan/chitin deacetylase (PgdA/CDA1 family)